MADAAEVDGEEEEVVEFEEGCLNVKNAPVGARPGWQPLPTWPPHDEFFVPFFLSPNSTYRNSRWDR